LNPNNATAHNGLGISLEMKGDLRDALEEYRTAYMLAPRNAMFKQSYDDLLLRINKR
jgi:Flp pilus assembly protein TadD